ncbi:MAG TPA: GMC family oxidoreductase [Pseudomonadota bacterium]|nr:GMC family oxidoreductase [Pseudomonadota bacterium]
MSHISFQAEPLSLSVDYVVVGSGAGGATAACELARGGASVALVEAGPWLDPENYPSSVYGAMRDLFDDWGTQVARGRALWPLVQGSCVGGSTVINCAICVRTPDDIFEKWQREHGLPDLRQPLLAHQEALEAELCATEVPPESVGLSNAAALRGANQLGYASKIMTRYVKGCLGSGQCLQGCRGQRKQSLNVNFVPEVLARGGSVLSCAPVSRILLSGNRAVGVRGRFRHPRTRQRGGEFVVHAKKAVIVAASVTWSPCLLAQSGVRSPALGSFFRAHPGFGLFGVYDDPIDANRGATQGWASVAYREHPGFKMETLALPPEMMASRLSGGGSALLSKLRDYRHLAMWVIAVRAETVGTVRPGLLGKPVVRYSADRADMERVRKGLAQVARTHFAAGARRVLPVIYGLPYSIGPDEISVIEEGPLDPRAYISILSHLFGGCVMGRDPESSVVDDRGRVHGYDGLVVADASVIPTNLGVNPQHTIMALARHFAQGLLAG